MNDTRIASKAKAQLANFMGKVFTHFSKPSRKFIEECIYGIQASGDTKLSSIVRAIDDDIRPIYTEKRLSRNLDDEALEAAVAQAILAEGARTVRSDTLLLVDPTEIRKEFAHAMEHVTLVRDASRSSKEGRDVLVNIRLPRSGQVARRSVATEPRSGRKGPSYHGCMVAAYAIADGIKRAFTRFGKWVRTAADAIVKAPDVPAIQLLPGFAELLDTDGG